LRNKAGSSLPRHQQTDVLLASERRERRRRPNAAYRVVEQLTGIPVAYAGRFLGHERRGRRLKIEPPGRERHRHGEGDRHTGSREKADIVLVDVMAPWCQPIYKPNLITSLVFNANGSDVTDVFVDGRQIVKGRDMTTVDRKAILKETQRRAERIWGIASKSWD
jgi:hypothetical protein